MTFPAGYTLRPATAADAVLIQAQRDEIFTDMGLDADRVQAVSAASQAWLRGALSSGLYQGWLVEDPAGQVVAGAGVSWQQPQPSPVNGAKARAYLDNVYVAPQARRQGLARSLVQRLLSECGHRDVRLVTLHATAAGRPLYEQLGFVPTDEMRLLVPVAVAPVADLDPA
ncbi:GNAT family N-acetyltransferase [Deinococcus altitudinis]|uniref:GNAT family N-acetyltransferase n=1 Tax=Deinococcus altitudinis TaxID=468914 RepID=UPI003891668E